MIGRNSFWKMLGDREGASHAEYALILAIIGTVIAFCALWLGGMMKPTMNDAATCISTSGNDCTERRLGRDLSDARRPVR